MYLSSLFDGLRTPLCLMGPELFVFLFGKPLHLITVGPGDVRVPVTLHIAGTNALRVGERSGTEREELIPKYSFASQKPWDICFNLDCITNEEIS